MHVAIDTDEIPGRDGFDCLRAAAAELPEPITVGSDRPAACRASMGMSVVDNITVGTVINKGDAALTVRRTSRLIRRSDPELVCLAVPLQGAANVSQNRADTMLRPGTVALYDTSRPYNGGFSDSGADLLVVGLPRAALAMRSGHLGDIVAVGLQPSTALTNLLAACVGQVARDAPGYSPEDASRVATIVTDLCASAISSARGDAAQIGLDGNRRLLLVRTKSYIDANLTSPRLGPSSVAAAHHVGVRTLYRAFEVEGLTVAGWIRHRRLERCRQDLIDPTMSTQSIDRIARRWGFADGAHLSKSFRDAYGLSPSAYRQCR